jgi:hypothetical protein
MSPIETEVVRITQSANPVPDESVAGSIESDEARLLLARITAEPAAAPPRRTAWVKFGIPAAVSMAGAIGLLAGPLLQGGPDAIPDVAAPEPQTLASGSPVILEHIAAVAALQPAMTVPDEGFRYTKSRTRYMSTTAGESFYTVLQSTVREIWIARDGAGRIRTEVGEIEFLTERDKQAWEAAGSPALRGEPVSDHRFAGGDPGGTSLYFETFEGLTADPDQLYAEIEKRAEGRGPGLHPEMFVIVGDMLRETGAPPELRSALFRVAARIPGVEVNENASDPTGRPGVAVSHTHNPGGRIMRNELIFDKDTSALLSEGQFVGEKSPTVGPTESPGKAPADAPPAVGGRDFYGDLPAGTQVGGAVYFESGIVDSVEERPGG